MIIGDQKRSVVADTIDQALYVMAAFDLDGDVWMPWTFGRAVVGRRWDQIVVTSPLTGWTDQHRQYVDDCLRPKTQNLWIL